MEHSLVATWENFEDVPTEYLFERLRNARNKLLAESDWTQLEDSPVDKEAWANYRQELRDAPAVWTPDPIWVSPAIPS